ncbi:dehydrogenase [Capsulimonas corticalis]|uniref:Dehydrogenase n=1 Tax=Capsulimonas corticalis TaxID=2219043 RepID=A0A402CVS1_9BACT|nr:Gfo/Idh/MocA family oxidoreductase [Capsulimonas corticalis]BDI30505.1 dehydrogenase [Capsulimonas corticalis]
MKTNPIKVGVVGCGNISNIYFKTAQTLDILEVVACADLDLERARAKAAEHGVAKACSVEELLADPEIQIVINLTIPGAHFDVCKAALDAGKHTYVEKPLALTRAQGRELLELARAKGLRIGGAPDTFLGAGLQTCRKVIDDGWIGEPVAATAFMFCHGHESWHPDPEFYYKPGGGPLFDMGPYYLTALVALMGPITRIAGSARKTFAERTITSAPKNGQTIVVETPTHIAGTAEFASGAVATLVTSFDVWASTLPPIEIHGSLGSLSVPDPNTFGGRVQINRQGAGWEDVPLTHGFAEDSRGLGVADMALAIREDRPARAGGDLTYHVLEAMLGFLDSSEQGRYYTMESTVDRPAALPGDWLAAE